MSKKKETEVLRSVPIQLQLDELTKKVLESDLDSIKIADEVQLLRTGKFNHPQFGELEIKSEMLLSMVKNFNEKVRGVDIAVDYKHDSDDIAAGWIKELILKENATELWANVEWTKSALHKLADKEFRYLSADFSLNFIDNETGQEFGPTLFGAGLTNRPFVKRMDPAVALTEVTEKTKKSVESKTKSTDNSDKLQSKDFGTKLNENNQTYQGEDMPEDKKKMEAQEGDDLSKLSPEQMLAMIKDLQAKLAKLEGEKDQMMKEKQLSEKKAEFAKLVADGKAVPAQEEAFIEGDMTKFVELSKPVNLSEKKAEPQKKETKEKKFEGDAQDEVTRLAEEKMKDNKNLDLGRAISLVLDEKPELKKIYETETSVSA